MYKYNHFADHLTRKYSTKQALRSSPKYKCRERMPQQGDLIYLKSHRSSNRWTGPFLVTDAWKPVSYNPDNVVKVKGVDTQTNQIVEYDICYGEDYALISEP